jgi:hypothetical protein
MDKNSGTTDGSSGPERINWHPAFFEAIMLELEPYGDSLQFISEYQLATAPLRIDVLIVKKMKDIPIKKNIAAIFREVNIIEYKGPDDYVSVADFYQVYGYACLYAALNNSAFTGITLTFVESRHPDKLFGHFRNVRSYRIEEKEPGIYYIEGDILPIQVIDSQKLSAEENLWLKELDNRLEAPDIRRIVEEIGRQGKGARIRAYLDAISRANIERLKEIAMSDSALTLEQVFEEAGWIAKWEARGKAMGKAMGEANKAREIAKNMLANGFSDEQTARLAGLTVDQIKALRN